MTAAPSGRSHTQRLILEQLGQMLVVASGFLDRLLLTALLLRRWDISTFEAWSACIALSATVSLFELGFNLYFNNQLMIEMERGDRAAFLKTYSVGNSLFACSAVGGFALLVGLIFFAEPLGAHADSRVALTAIVLCGANSAKIALCAVYALYRANRDYARFAAIQGVSEITRIACVIAAVALGADLLDAAVTSAIATTFVAVAFVVLDTRHRYFPHAYAFRIPHRSDVRGILGISTLYMAQAVPLMMYASLPVIVLQKMALAPGLLASFVLIRTLANVARTPLQSVGIVMGQEAGRRIAVADLDGARRVMETSGRLFAVVSGLTSGLLLAGGEILTRYWTGSRELFDGPLMVAAAMPMILTPVAVLSHNVLSSYQAPILPAIARWVQFGVTVIAYLFMPQQSPPIRMMAALSLGEIIGYAPVAYWATSRLVPGAGWKFHSWNLSLVVASTIFGATITHFSLALVSPLGDAARLMSFAAVGSIFALSVLFVGVDADGRRRLIDQTIAPLRRRLFPSSTTRRRM